MPRQVTSLYIHYKTPLGRSRLPPPKVLPLRVEVTFIHHESSSQGVRSFITPVFTANLSQCCLILNVGFSTNRIRMCLLLPCSLSSPLPPSPCDYCLRFVVSTPSNHRLHQV